jgi:hypothetical protein
MATNNTNAKSANASYASNKAGAGDKAYNYYNQYQQIYYKQYESMSAANQVVMEGGQNLARYYNDAAQNQMRQYYNFCRNYATAGYSSPAEMQEYLKDYTTHSIQNYYNAANNAIESYSEIATNLVSVYGEGLSNFYKEMYSYYGNYANYAKNNYAGTPSN